MTSTDILAMADRVHTANKKWWQDLETGQPIERNVGELLMLCVSELSEALEGDRKNLMDDKLPHRKMIEVELTDAMIRTLDIIGGLHLTVPSVSAIRTGWRKNVAENLLIIVSSYIEAYEEYELRDSINGNIHFRYSLARSLVLIIELAEHLGLDIMGAYEEKMAYNAVRHDHSVEGRKSANGKKY